MTGQRDRIGGQALRLPFLRCQHDAAPIDLLYIALHRSEGRLTDKRAPETPIEVF
jgi:hypothetical protein